MVCHSPACRREPVRRAAPARGPCCSAACPRHPSRRSPSEIAVVVAKLAVLVQHESASVHPVGAQPAGAITMELVAGAARKIPVVRDEIAKPVWRSETGRHLVVCKSLHAPEENVSRCARRCVQRIYDCRVWFAGEDTVDFIRRAGLSRPRSVTGVWFVGRRRSLRRQDPAWRSDRAAFLQ